MKISHEKCSTCHEITALIFVSMLLTKLKIILGGI